LNAALPAPEKPQLLEEAPSHGNAGRRPPNAKLTKDQVREIRRSELAQVEIAALYGISETTVSFVRRNLNYVDPTFVPPKRVLTSAQRGVRFHRQSGKWRVAFRRDRVYHTVGSYSTEEEAIAAAVAWEVAHPLPPKAARVYKPGELSPEMRAWVARRKREIAGEPLTAADREQLARSLEDTDAITEHSLDADGWS